MSPNSRDFPWIWATFGPPDLLAFQVGDSTSTDFFVATLLGAFRLGWRRTYWCGQFGASYLHGAWDHDSRLRPWGFG